VRRKTVHEHGVRRGERHQLGVDLISLKDGASHLPLASKPMLSTHRCKTACAPVTAWRGSVINSILALVSRATRLLSATTSQWRIIPPVWRRASERRARCQINERVANVVAVADVGEFESAQSAEFFSSVKKSASACRDEICQTAR